MMMKTLAVKASTAAGRAATALILAAAAIAALQGPAAATDSPRRIPAPAVDETASDKSETVVLAGGCFWGVQGVFQHVRGVADAVSGYAGGDKDTAQYETVSTGSTGHAESVRVTFDPSQVSLGRILQIYFSVVHDPTELNRQGPDYGTQYRSEIFPQTTEQARVATAYIAQLDHAHAFAGAIVTRVETGKSFYPAEDYHQDFLARNPTYPYIVYNDLPKIAALQTLFPDSYRASPVLVSPTSTTD